MPTPLHQQLSQGPADAIRPARHDADLGCEMLHSRRLPAGSPRVYPRAVDRFAQAYAAAGVTCWPPQAVA